MAANLATPLVINAVNTAAAHQPNRCAGVIFHSDRGSQYLSGDFASALKHHQMAQSVGRVGNCWDNSVSESFFATLKRELVTQTRFKTRKQARQAIFAWIGYYNTHRLHSTLNNQTPTEWENQQNQQQPQLEKAA